MRGRTNVIIGAVTAVLVSSGCELVKDEKKEKAERVESAAEALKRAQSEECTKLRTQPAALLETGGMQYHDKGIINDYRQLTGLTVLNRARYCAVRSAEGDVTWLNARGERLGSSPFTLRKSIPAGGTEQFSVEGGTMTSGTIQGDGKTAQIRFTRVEVVQPD